MALLLLELVHAIIDEFGIFLREKMQKNGVLMDFLAKVFDILFLPEKCSVLLA